MCRTLTEADGKVGWGVYGSTWAYREGVGGKRSGGGLGRFTIVGRVVDVDGNAVVDAEVVVGEGGGLHRHEREFESAFNRERVAAETVIDAVGRRSRRMHHPRVSTRGPQCIQKVQAARASRRRKSAPRPLPPTSHAE